MSVSFKRFANEFKKRFGHNASKEHFVLWCVMWGGTLRGDQCVFSVEV